MGRPAAPTPAHAERAHADISPSGAERWWNCPGSVDLIAKLQPKRTTNVYSEQGTAAHELLDMALTAGRAPIAYLGHVVNKGSKAAIGVEFRVDRAMSVCVEEAIDYINSFRRKGDTLLTEQELDIPATGQPGHVDVALYCSKVVDVFDYKHGTNPVEVRGNKQAMLYALGVIEYIRQKKLMYLSTIKLVRIHIIQPRSHMVDHTGPAVMHEIKLRDLDRFAGEVRNKVEAIRAGAGKLVPGEVQCHYCPVKAQCPALAKSATDAARLDFEDVITKKAPHKSVGDPFTPLSNTDLGNAMTAIPLMELWMVAVREFAAREISAGRKVPGWKVVEGQSRRRWADEEAVKKALAKMRIDEDDYAPRKLLGLGAIESILKPAAREPFFTKHCIKPRGNPTLAPEGDPRPHFDGAAGAKIDFEDDILK